VHLLVWRSAATVDRHQEPHNETSEINPAAVSAQDEIVAAAFAGHPGLLPASLLPIA
jgi:hypothetical protein